MSSLLLTSDPCRRKVIEASWSGGEAGKVAWWRQRVAHWGHSRERWEFFKGWGVFRVHICVCTPATLRSISVSLQLLWLWATAGQKASHKQCFLPFVSHQPFFFSPPSQSTGLLCIDSPHSAARQPLSAGLYALFPWNTSPAAAPVPLLASTTVWERRAPLGVMLLVKDS